MAFQLNSQAQDVSGKNEQSTQTPCRGAQCSCIGCIGLRPALSLRIAFISQTQAMSIQITGFLCPRDFSEFDTGTPESGGTDPPFEKGQRGQRCLFMTVSFQGLSISAKNKFIVAICPSQKIHSNFPQICYYFWGGHCCWSETSILVTTFCFLQVSTALKSFPAPPALTLLRRPWLGAFFNCWWSLQTWP